MAKTDKYDFVGHITYQYTPVTKAFFFEKNVTKMIYTVKRDGKEIYKYTSKMPFGKEFPVFLSSVGYEIREERVPDPNAHQSKKTISIPCTNEDCRHYCETYNKRCIIKTKSTVEKIDGNTSETTEKNIILSYGARDIRELTAKSECLLWHIKDMIGIEGFADIYGKMEMC